MLRAIFEKIIKGEQLTDAEQIYLLLWAEKAMVLQPPPAQNITVVEQHIAPLEEMVFRVVDNYIRGRLSINNLGEISDQLGLVLAGEFRSGNDKAPGDGFSGVRIGYPPFAYDSEDWNIAGLNSDVLQFGLRASDGKAIAGGGAVILDAEGVTLPDSGDAFTLTTYNEASDTTSRTHFSLLNDSPHITTYELSSTTSRISNGDFETGDLTNWTETDPSGGISVQQVDGSYVAVFDNVTYSTHNITQNLSSAAAFGVVVTFRAKASSGFMALGITCGGATRGAYLYPEWRTYHIKFTGSTSDIKIQIGSTGIGYIDDIVVEPIDGNNQYGTITLDGASVIKYGLTVNQEGKTGNGTYFEVVGASSRKLIHAYTTANRVGINLPSGLPTANATLDVRGTVIINDDGEDADTRIEGDTDPDLIHTDASTDRVGIGIAAPTEKLDVVGNIKASGTVTGSNTTDEYLQDTVGAMVTGNTETGIAVTYDDAGGKLNFDAQTAGDARYAPIAKGVTNGDTHDHNGGDGAQINHTTLSNIGTYTHAQLDDIDNTGWLLRSETWTRTGDHTFTVSGDLTTTFRKGTKIRYKDGGAYEYGVVGSSSHAAGTTTVNLIPTTDYAMAAATITDKYISYIENPEGYPHIFAYTPTITASSGTYTTVSATGQFTVIGREITCSVIITITNNGTAAGSTYATLPVTALSGTYYLFGTEYQTTGNAGYGRISAADLTKMRIFKMDGTYLGGTGYIIAVSGKYFI
jgi:hypothetical protein